MLDVNDNRPQFLSDAYRFSVSEDIASFSVIGNIVAVDNDAGNNSTVSYSIVSGNESEFAKVPLIFAFASLQLLRHKQKQFILKERVILECSRLLTSYQFFQYLHAF